MPINDRQLSRQKVLQKISVIITNTNHRYKHFCFQDKTWIKMPNWTIFLISSKVSNSKSKEFVLITEIFWQIFWRDNWRSLIAIVENFRYYFVLYQDKFSCGISNYLTFGSFTCVCIFLVTNATSPKVLIIFVTSKTPFNLSTVSANCLLSILNKYWYCPHLWHSNNDAVKAWKGYFGCHRGRR